MFARLLGVSAVLAVLFAGSTMIARRMPVNCCEKRMACCLRSMDCCRPDHRMRCCAQGQECCDRPAACCNAR